MQQSQKPDESHNLQQLSGSYTFSDASAAYIQGKTLVILPIATASKGADGGQPADDKGGVAAAVPEQSPKHLVSRQLQPETETVYAQSGEDSRAISLSSHKPPRDSLKRLAANSTTMGASVSSVTAANHGMMNKSQSFLVAATTTNEEMVMQRNSSSSKQHHHQFYSRGGSNIRSFKTAANADDHQIVTRATPNRSASSQFIIAKNQQ